MYKVKKDLCVGCGTCTVACPEGARIADDGKSEIINQEKVAECGGVSICPFGAIEEVEGESEETKTSQEAEQKEDEETKEESVENSK